MKKILSKWFIAPLIWFVGIVCAASVATALIYAALSSPLHIPAIKSDAQPFTNNEIIAWVAALSAAISAVVTTGSFFFLYQTMRASWRQLESTQAALALETEKTKHSRDVANESRRFQDEALTVQTRPFVEITSIQVREERLGEEYAYMKIDLNLENYGSSPALDVDVIATAIPSNEWFKPGTKSLAEEENIIGVVRHAWENEAMVAYGYQMGAGMPSLGPSRSNKLQVVVKTPVLDTIRVGAEAENAAPVVCMFGLAVLISYGSYRSQHDELRRFRVAARSIPSLDRKSSSLEFSISHTKTA